MALHQSLFFCNFKIQTKVKVYIAGVERILIELRYVSSSLRNVFQFVVARDQYKIIYYYIYLEPMSQLSAA